MKKILYIVLSILSIFSLYSCIEDIIGPEQSIESAEKEYTFYIKVPGTEDVTLTRSESAAKDVDFRTLKMFLFKGEKNQSGGIDYHYYKELSNPFDDNNSPVFNNEEKAYQIKVKFPKEEIDKVKILFFANIANDKFARLENKTIDEFREALQFNANEVQKSSEFQIPFWGETNSFKLDEDAGTKYDSRKIKVNLVRAVAKLQVSSNIVDEKITLISIIIHNSAAASYTIPFSSNYRTKPNGFVEITAPSEVANARIQPDRSVDYNATDKNFGEIYFAEQVKGKTCILLKAKYGDAPESYYRIDFVKGDNNGELIDIKRNSRYILTLNGIKGPGYPDIEEALKNRANIDVSIDEWDEGINNGYIYGDKYFGIETNEVEFDYYKKYPDGHPNQGQNQQDESTVKTNIVNIEETVNLNFTTLDGSPIEPDAGNFTASLIKTEGTENQYKLVIAPKAENRSDQPYQENLSITIAGKIFVIKVTQNSTNPDYRILCEKTKVYGVYLKNTNSQETENFIRITIMAKEDISGKTYNIFTNEIDGMSFSANGTFSVIPEGDHFTQTIDLASTGTPATSIPKSYIIIPNSLDYHSCEALVKMAYRPKKIFSISEGEFTQEPIIDNSNNQGYSTQNSASAITRTSEAIYGLQPTSIIKTYPLTDFTHKAISYRYSTLSTEELKAGLSNADIFITGYPYRQGRVGDLMTNANVTAQYLKQGGVYIAICESPNAINALFKALYNGSSIANNITAATYNRAGTLYNFEVQQDEIMDGPFGNCNGKKWGEDGSQTMAIKGLPEEDIVVYSYCESEGRRVGVTILRHKKYNLFIIGDGGFISQKGTEWNSQNRCPYWIVTDKAGRGQSVGGFRMNRNWLANRTNPFRNYKDWKYLLERFPDGVLPEGFPVPSVFGDMNPAVGGCYNSVFFNNVLAWAIDKAEFEGRNGQEIIFTN